MSAFGEQLNQPQLASPSRPVWVVDRPRDLRLRLRVRRAGRRGHLLHQRLGARPPPPRANGAIRLGVTAIKPGRHVVA